MLGGGAKMTLDKESISIKGPMSMLQGSDGPGGPGDAPGPGGTFGEGATSTGVQGATSAPTSEAKASQSVLSTLLRGNLGVVNPSGSPLGDLTGADLAGLTTRDISQALQFKLAQDDVGRQSVNDLISNIYKLSQIEQGAAAVGVAKAREARLLRDLTRQAPLNVPGLGRLSLDEWEALDTKTKAYSYYAFNANQQGENVLPYNEFVQQADPSSLVQYYDLAKKDPEFKEFYFESKKAGAARITIGEKAESRKALNWVDAVDDMQKDVEKHMASDIVQDKLIQYDMGSEEEAIAKAGARVKFIEQRIRTAGGKIIDVSYDPETKIMIWTVRNPLGEKEEISYGIRN
jgi:hypothetical protein